MEDEGDDEGDDESDEEKGFDGQGEEGIKNDTVAISRAKTVAMVEMEVEEFRKIDIKDTSWSLTDKQVINPLPRAEGQLSVPISFSNSQKLLKLSPVIIR